MERRTSKALLQAVAALSLSVVPALAATAPQLSGSIAGVVRDNSGLPQMGATVLLINRYERVVQRAFTNERGIFGFALLTPDLYAVRVSLASFVPAMKEKIAVQAGIESLLYINMASMLSTVELVYASPSRSVLMSDDWRLTLKSSASTRPVLRILPQVSVSDPDQPQHTPGAIFSDTRGLFNVSAGDGGSNGDLTMQSDLGTAFALATSVFGRNQLQVSGNVGHATRTGLPIASLRTSYSNTAGGPEVTLTMRQLYLPSHVGNAVAGNQSDGMPALRTMSLAMIDRLDLADNLRLEYGASLDSVSFIERLNYVSPFARLSLEMGGWGTARAAYSSGAPPAELFASKGDPEVALHQDLSVLALGPRVSLHDGRARVQRTQSMELGYEKRFGSSVIHAAAFSELVSNAALTMAGPGDLLPEGDLLPNFSSSESGTFDGGHYRRYGYSGTFTQPFGDKLELSASAGRAGALVTAPGAVESTNADEIRSRIHLSQRYWASVHAAGTIPVAGTRLSTSYQWTDYNNTILPTHLDLTQKASNGVGWNVAIRQPLPNIPGLPGRLEASAELRNMLAQGYMAIPTVDSRRILLMQSPRAVRGGLSFIF